MLNILYNSNKIKVLCHFISKNYLILMLPLMLILQKLNFKNIAKDHYVLIEK